MAALDRVRTAVKSAVVWAACQDLLPRRVAEFVVRVGGLRDNGAAAARLVEQSRKASRAAGSKRAALAAEGATR